MKIVRTLVLILLCAVVIGLYIYQTKLEKQVVSQPPLDEVKKTFTLEPNDLITFLQIERKDQESPIVVEKEDDQWMLISPVIYSAEPHLVEGLIAAIRQAAKQKRFRAEKGWAQYGLAEPQLKVIFQVKTRKERKVLAFGDQAPIGNLVYGRWESEPGYVLLPIAMRDAFKQTPYQLREKRIVRTPAAQMKKVYIELGAQGYEWVKDGDQWFWLEPITKLGQKISAEQMNLILQALQNLHAKEFLDDQKKPLWSYGFFIIHDRIKIESAEGAIEQFHFGNELPLKDAYYSFRERENVVFLIERGKVFQLLDLVKAVEKGKGTGPEGSPVRPSDAPPAYAPARS